MYSFQTLDTKRFQRLFDLHKMLKSWFRRYRLFMLLLILVAVAIGGWQWYDWVYRYEWSAEQKKNYVQSHIRETQFQKEAFEEALERSRERRERHLRLPDIRRDLFR